MEALTILAQTGQIPSSVQLHLLAVVKVEITVRLVALEVLVVVVRI
jgi:hypothetical protein